MNLCNSEGPALPLLLPLLLLMIARQLVGADESMIHVLVGYHESFKWNSRYRCFDAEVSLFATGIDKTLIDPD